MPRQKGPLKWDGSLGDVTYYKGKDGYLIKEKTDLGKKVKNDPKFQRTRENGAEFGRAGKAGKLLRTTFRLILLKTSDGRMVSRLTQKMVEVLKADPVSDRGLRNVTKGDVLLLKGFEFNINSNLSTTLFANHVAVIDRATGQVTVSLPAFVPRKLVASPDGATHFKIVSGAAAINFESGNTVADLKDTGFLPVNNDPTADISLQYALTPNSTDPIFVLLGIEFCQVINGKQYAMKNGAFNAAAIIDTSAN